LHTVRPLPLVLPNANDSRPGKEKKIIITAYSPLGNNITGKPRVIDAPAVKEIAKKVNKTPAQILIAWGAHQGFVVIPKSVTPERIRSNFEDFKLEEEDFEAINSWGKKNRVRSNAPYEYKPQYVPVLEY
jgi:L-glyceraldehyde reductase